MIDLQKANSELESALELVRQDHWLLGGLRDGKLRVIAESSQLLLARRTRRRELTPLARCLFERRPLALSSLAPDDVIVDDDQWELEWPAILYAPVGSAAARPVGILIVGSRKPHWYDQQEIEYVSSLAAALTLCVSSVVGPLGRLDGFEQQVARLLGEGLSAAEVARALNVDRSRAQGVIDRVLQKLSVKSRHQVRELFPEQLACSNGFLL
jgi:DNA-binding CsgD family transcriptional regulator